MKKNEVDAYLITKPHDYYYLTGFTGEDSAVLVTSRAITIFTDGRFDETFALECPWAKKILRRSLIAEPIGQFCKDKGVEKLHVQPDGVNLAELKNLKKFCKPTKTAEAPDLIRDMRTLKDAGEVKIITQAIRIAEESMLALRRFIKPGQTENEIAARLEYEMRMRGASAPSFSSIVAVGPNGSLPHYRPGQRAVKKGSAVLIDWGARYKSYCSDLTRVLFVGSIPRTIGAVYSIVANAQHLAIDAIRPGVRMYDVDAVARDHIKNAGYGKNFGHGLGHGLGLDVHEAPSLSYRSDAKLEAGMLVTVEPGIYLPGVGGVRIEDDVLVTKTGARVLSRLSKDINDAVI
jgi:Xaa-Pro aminopeptidase